MESAKFEPAVKANIFTLVDAQINREIESRSTVAEEISVATSGENADGNEINVYQWWVVSDAFADAAKAAGEIIIETPFGTIWGRQTCMQGIAQDLNVQQIFKDMGAI